VKFFYLIECQYLGYRLHGWAAQPNVKTVQGLIERTIRFVLEDKKFRILGASRTDSMVSAEQTWFELFLEEDIDEQSFFSSFNENLPADIKALSIQKANNEFNVIHHNKTKEYTYLFTFGGEKMHPFAAPHITQFKEKLNIEVMKEAAKLFEGKHNFHAFAYRPSENAQSDRSVVLCEIIPNTFLTASFFPEKSWALHVKGAGFMRNQIRIMMNALVNVGMGKLQLTDLSLALENGGEMIANPAPASGLLLRGSEFQ
jgi:tRNA pseudouridine38-40 synthase